MESNYSPCTCQDNGNGPEVNCDKVPIDQVQEMFNGINGSFNTNDVYLIKLFLNSSDFKISANLMKNKRSKRIYLYGPADADGFKLEADKNAFQSSSGHAEFFGIYYSDMSNVNFEFLSGLDNSITH